MVSMLNNGQACYNGTRLLVPDTRYDEIVGAVAETVSSFTVGDALDPATHVGPMASAAHRDRVESYIAKGRDEARLVAGGGRPKGHNSGWFVEPTVFADVRSEEHTSELHSLMRISSAFFCLKNKIKQAKLT